MTKKAVLINDLSGLGKCSLTAAIAVLSVMGIQPCPMPTAVLTNQTGFNSFYCKDFTDELDFYTTEWKKLGFSPDGISTGFLSSENQVDKILSFIKNFKRDNTLILVDPVMGDDGKTYSLFTSTLASRMKKLVSAADVITPNLTEVCILCDCDYNELISQSDKPYFTEKIAELGERLIEQYRLKTVIITGIRRKNTTDGTPLICNLIIQRDFRFETKSPLIGKSYSGTGDLFSSIVFAGLLRGDNLKDVVLKAVSFIEKSLLDTVRLSVPHNEGIEFEKNLTMLL